MLETLKRVEDASIKIGSFTFLTLAVDANNEGARAYYDRVNDMDIERRQTFSALSACWAGSTIWTRSSQASPCWRSTHSCCAS